MSTIGVTLLFLVIISIFNLIKEFLFSNNIDSPQITSIGFKRLFSISSHKTQRKNKPYMSFYQAYYQLPSNQGPATQPLPASALYNQLVLKKMVINDEHVVLCQEKYLVAISEGIVQKEQRIHWEVVFQVYTLPYLHAHSHKQIRLQGRIGYTFTDGFNQKKKHLSCRKLKNSNQFVLSFYLEQSETADERSSLNDLIITPIADQFELNVYSYELMSSGHKPQLHISNVDCFAYVTQDEPWDLKYKCGRQWKTINILQKRIQKAVFNETKNREEATFFYMPVIRPQSLFLFSHSRKVYRRNPGCWNCQQQLIEIITPYLTYVYQQTNTPSVKKALINLTFMLEQAEQEQIQNCPLDSYISLISYSILAGDLNPLDKVHIDCKIHTKEEYYYQTRYEKFYWLAYQKLVAIIQKHSLMCITAFDLQDSFQVLLIRNLIGFPNSSFQEQYEIHGNRHWKKEKKKGKTKNENYSQPHQIITLGIEDFDSDEWLPNLQMWDLLGLPQQEESSSSEQMNNSVRKPRKSNKTLKLAKDRIKQRIPKMSLLSKQNIDGHSNNYSYAVTTNQALGYFDNQTITQIKSKFYSKPMRHRSKTKKYRFGLPLTLSFTRQLSIINSNPETPLILFSSIKPYLFTFQVSGTTINHRYLPLGDQMQDKEVKESMKQMIESIEKMSIQNEMDLAITNRLLQMMANSESSFLHQIKAVGDVSIPKNEHMEFKKEGENEDIEAYKRNVIIIWGWGIEVYQVDWDQFLEKTESSDMQSLSGQIPIEYIMGLIHIFATLYCMFHSILPTRIQR